MTGGRGYQCIDGPLVGVVVMITEDAAVGSFWNVSGRNGVVHVYQFRGDRFECSDPPATADVNQVDGWVG